MTTDRQPDDGRSDHARRRQEPAPPMPDLLPGPAADRVVALVGNPNVGKSTLFNRLTGLDVLTAHYPGKTPRVNVGTTALGDRTVMVVDPPGAYALDDATEDQWVARRTLLDRRPDVVISVVDETNVARNLYLTLQLLDLGLPVVVALNLHDEAARAGASVDPVALTEMLGVPVVPTVATQGVGVEELMELALHVADERRPPVDPPQRYGQWTEGAIAPVARIAAGMPRRPWDLPPRALALQLVEGHEDAMQAVAEAEGGPAALRAAEAALRILGGEGDESANVVLARERYGSAGVIAARAGTRPEASEPLSRKLLRWTTSPLTGVPILAAVLLGVFGFLFFIGEALAAAVSAIWQSTASPAIEALVRAVAGGGMVGDVLLWGFDVGIEASLAIGIPYILTFYVLLALLEDSGYLGSVAFLADRVMHRLGLHGRAIVPLVAAAGCNVPAILATRSLRTSKERTIAATLAAIIPCSARSAVVLGAVAHYVGWAPALGVFLVSIVVTVAAGLLLNRITPGYTGGLVMEMFPFRRPNVRGVARKAWGHFREFVTVATPIVIASSLVLGLLYETGWLWRLTAPLAPVTVGLLGLPSVAGLTLLAGLVRKELALQLLVTLAIASIGAGASDLLTFMSPTDLFVYALVSTLAFPCVSAIAVLARTLGTRRTFVTILSMVTVAVLLGAVFARVLPALGWA